ncbi:hypothetical protein CC1G_00591 [Coprinopsis cinerea okayama7|uniref:Tyrosinase copper-binding domain-containing protein n=1 Tax=Coprinopsis cinerea (strain Okayama-7 / 130 / ATCC MYA-4618 / FGSC 9003) TaxID=240176 RepID=A8N3S0_COPC7|nr:hypothetical protein CC1G_00591 [Coprinopsis cinerea okayama7\|eukprot:XP_001829412.2 hypothetical protein CC1G_00591 [Coprinopsis cinerea okayama7\
MLLRAFCFLSLLSTATIVSSRPQSTDGLSKVDAADTIEYHHVDVNATLSGRPGHRPKPCKRLSVRREWRDLSRQNRLGYLRAVKCLFTTGAFNHTLPAKFNRYDEFVISHVRGQFLPWHRHFSYLYERALRDECGYRGPFPYWDWTRDVADPNKPISDSPLFDPVFGFGGDGVPGTYTPPSDDDGAAIPIIIDAFKGCVGTGPFADITLHVGPNVRFSDHCLNRNFIEQDRRPHFTPESVAAILGQATYDNFWNSLDGLPFKTEFRLHDAGHGYVGGDMSSFYSSPNDPLFYPHHTGLDRLWWKWQRADLPSRLYQMGGHTSAFPPHGEATLDHELLFADFAPSLTVRDAMDPRMEPYCYTYAD